MKITDVKVRKLSYRASYPIANSQSTHLYDARVTTIVEVLTDEGITGVSTSSMFDDMCRQIIAGYLKKQIVGANPLHCERIWHQMFNGETEGRAAIAKGEVIMSMSAIDTAIWDLVGKKLGVPLCHLLGGFRDQVPCYASGGHYTSLTSQKDELKHLEWEMAQYMEMGYKAVKMRVGRDVQQDSERAKLVREVIGPRTKLLMDFNSSPSYRGGVPHALKFIRALEKHDVYWFEDPLVMDDLAGLKQLSTVVDAAIAVGEWEQTRWGFRDLIKDRVVDVILPDATSMCGGVTEWRKIAAMADACRIPVAAHIGDNVHIHCIAAVPNGLIVEVFTPLETERLRYLRDPVLKPNRDGMLDVSTKPGTGLELDEDYISRHVAG